MNQWVLTASVRDLGEETEEYWEPAYLHPNGVWIDNTGTLLPEVVAWMYFSTLDGSKPLT